MHQLIDKKKKILIYLLFLFILSSIFNQELKKFFINNFLVNKLDYNNLKLNIQLDEIVGKNILTLNKNEIISFIDNYPILHSFQINKIYPNSLKIDFIETDIIAKFYKDGELFYLGENEKFFLINDKNIDVPIIKGFFEINNANNFLKLLKKSDLDLKSIDSLISYPSARWDIVFKNNLIIKLPINSDLKLIETAKLVLLNSEIEKKVIDLRIKNKMILSNE